MQAQTAALQTTRVADAKALNQELQELAGESMGWIPLEDRAYLHVSSEGSQDRVVITGLPDAGLNGENVLLLV